MADKKQVKIFGHLIRELGSDLCTRCGACVTSCPHGSIKLEDGPSLDGVCTACGMCYSQCPQFTTVLGDAEEIFGEKADFEGVGLYKNAYSARSKIPEVQEKSQDGGVVTSLLVSLLDSDFIDGAVLTGIGEKPWKPEPHVAISREEIINHSGTIYSPSSAIKGLRDAVDRYKKDNIAIVGTPCQVKGLQRMKLADRGAKKYRSRVKLIIGLFCMESFPYENVLKIVENELGVDISNVEKFDIEKGNFIVQTEDEEAKIPVKNLKEFMCTFCEVCLDFAAELADISVGNVGVPGGYNAVLTRTDTGEEAFRKTAEANSIEYEPLSEVEPGLGLIEKLSDNKKEERKEEIERRKEEGQPMPPRAEETEE